MLGSPVCVCECVVLFCAVLVAVACQSLFVQYGVHLASCSPSHAVGILCW
jgi:hypothetical protein